MSLLSRRSVQLAALGAALTGAALVGAAPAGADPVPFAGHAKSTSTAAAKRAAVHRLHSVVHRSALRAGSSTVVAVERSDRRAGDTPADPTPPATTVPVLEPVGTSGAVTLTADSSAPFVIFEVDSGPVDGQAAPTPVAVTNGKATATYSTWGQANGASHSVTAADCATSDVTTCNATTAQADLTVTNDAPVITAPSDGDTITGGFTVTATAPGGAIEFEVDGSAKAVDTSSPYSFSYTGSALSSGAHTITVVECSADGSRCDGPDASISITSNSLHPSISAASPSTFSPNGDRYKDTTTVTYSLPDRETATIDVLNSAHSVVRSAGLGTHSGRHTWTWNGRTSSNKVAGSGRYTIRLSTSAVRNGATVRGSVSTSVVLDNRAPSLTSVHYGTSIYPHHDGYKDSFPVSFTTNERTTASLVILNAKHKVIRTISTTHAAGRVTLTWTGTDSHHHGVAAGTYGWYLSWHDAVNNKGRTGLHHLTLSLRKLVTEHKTITRNGDSYWSAGGSDPSCSEASTSLSQYTHGVWLENACDPGSDGLQVAAAFYHVTLPAAVSYSSLHVQVGGFALTPPASMFIGYGKKGGSSDYVFGHEYEITNDSEGYWGLGTVNPTGLLNSHHVMNLAVNVDNIDAPDDFDIAAVRLTVTYKVLK